MNKLKHKLLSWLTIVFIIFSNTTYSNANYDYDDYDNSYDGIDLDWYDYYIKDMNVDVEVNDKREYIITEVINVYYNVPKHGIIRILPFKSSLENYKIKNITVNGAPYSISKENDMNIKIGSERKTVIGDKQYTIKYTLKHFEDGVEDGDYLYLNVLGDNWDVPVEKFNSVITYPKNFKLDNLNITSGQYGESTNEYAEYEIKDNSIIIQSKGVIPTYSAVTANVKFEEGAFCNAPINPKIYVAIVIGIATIALFVVTVILVFISKGRIKRIVKPVDFYPPENMSSVDMGYLYTDLVTSEMIVSYIYSWASKGYIRIDTSEEDNVILIRLKDLDVGDSFEKKLFKEIFGCGSKNKVSESQLQYKLHTTFKNIKRDVKRKYKDDERYSKKTSSFASNLIKSLSILLCIVSMTYEYFMDTQQVLVGILTVIILYFCVGQAMIIDMSKEISYDFNKSLKDNLRGSYDISKFIFWLVIFYIFLIAFVEVEYSLLKVMSLTIPSFIIFLLSIMINNKKSSYEEDIYGRICGFREFIEKAEKSRLEMLISEDPEYFYNILPYAQALGITEVWTDKFKGIDIKPSEYYYGCTNYYSINRMSRSLERSMNSASSKKPESSSSSGGGFSGGGFSGGGSGGGGGRSW